jgi:beta-glucanase (GH16 family)
MFCPQGQNGGGQPNYLPTTKQYDMKLLKSLLLLTALTAPAAEVLSQNWQLVWSDDFTTGIGPDWVFETGNGSGGWGNNELQYYRRENATVQNGQLVITAKRESFGGYNYTSVRMKTQGKKSWKYGKIEARIAMPAFQGSWPAFWMLGDNISTVGWPACGEIDVMEHVNTGSEVRGTIHWWDHNSQYAQYGGGTNTSVTAFHVYTVEWNASTIKWFVDGVQFHVVDIANGVNGTHEFHNNFFILLNFAIGGNWPGFTIDNNAFPASMYVDYVKVYQNNGTPPPPSTTIQAESYGSMSGVQTESTTDAGGGLNVGYIDTGDWMAYSNINFPTSGAYTIEYRVASLNGGGRLSADLNAGSIVLGAIDVPSTGGWQNWTTISHTVNVNAGTYNFGVYAQSGGWNLNWIRITKQGAGLLSTTNTAATAELAEARTTVDPVFDLYPNPVVGNDLTIRSNEDLSGGHFKILDQRGKQMASVASTSSKIDVSTLTPGLYTLVFTRNGKTVTKHFLK